MCCHYLEVPTIAPELAYRTLRTTLTEQQCRIFLVLVEVWWKYNPYQHLLAVCSLYPAFLNLTHFKLVVEGLVLPCHLLHLCFLYVLSRSNDI